jgi:eukaryotic-like serine/threonine-protein kinase
MTEISDQPTIPNLTKDVTPLLPKKIGPYKIEGLLKKGGMSFLYLGSQPQSARPIVIKVLSPKFIKNEEMVQRFLKEADIIRLSNHPNIIKLYGQGTWEGGLYIAMEFIQGISLKQFLLEKSLSLKKALEIVLQVAYALCHLHSHGVIHRDLKPENILITENGEIKVIDFGIAQIIEEEVETKTKHFIGTPVYMSPEQKLDPSKVNFSSDIYSLGIITYELILGKLSHGIIQLSLIPKKLRFILEKALADDVKDRYADVVDFITDLSEYLKLHAEIEDKKNEEKYDEIRTLLLNTDKLFLTKDIHNWKQLDIAIEKEVMVSSSGLYIDFFKLSENIFACVVAEATKKDLESFIHMAILRGYIRMEMTSAEANKDFHPSSILTKINSAITKDLMNEQFCINLIVINLAQDQIFYSNSMKGEGYYIDNNIQKLTNIVINNQLLGAQKTSSFIETTLNFNVSDRLILLTKSVHPQKSEAVKKLILDNMLFSAAHQAEKIMIGFKNFIIKKENEITAVICIERKA